MHSILAVFFSARTINFIKFDLIRYRARRNSRSLRVSPTSNKLHLGCGARRVPDWLNVDVAGSDFNVDLASGCLPWQNSIFDVVVSQHLIEHLDLLNELLPLFVEIKRVVKPGGKVWLSGPDMKKICAAYNADKGKALVYDKLERFPEGIAPHYFIDKGVPYQHVINILFNQDGEHKNLFDFELLSWALRKAGFDDIREMTEQDFSGEFPEFPARNDELQTLYVLATSKEHNSTHS